MELKDRVRDVKQLFYTYRNGIIADRLRNSLGAHKIIFGLNMMQLSEIANRIQKDKELAEFLWDNSSTRESQMLAPMIYPLEDFSYEMATQWIEKIPNVEIADILCFKLLRYSDFALPLAIEATKSDNTLVKYTGLRLLLNLIILNKLDADNLQNVKSIANMAIQNESSIIISIAKAILEEIESNNQ